MIKKAILQLVHFLGYELTPRQMRNSLEGVLDNARRCGLAPATIIDAGAGRGDFSLKASRSFPNAAFAMIEPLAEFSGQLRSVAASLSKSTIVRAVLSECSGKASLNVHADLFGSSLLFECENTNVNGSPRVVPAVTIDEIVAQHELKPPYFLKADVQGAELSVLTGAGSVLAKTDMVILETSFFHFFENGPLFEDVVAFMKARDFVPYDIFGLSYRPLDGALAQVDVVFVRTESVFRTRHEFATAEQRAALTRRLRS